jgi:hypothetical protein
MDITEAEDRVAKNVIDRQQPHWEKVFKKSSIFKGKIINKFLKYFSWYCYKMDIPSYIDFNRFSTEPKYCSTIYTFYRKYLYMNLKPR